MPQIANCEPAYRSSLRRLFGDIGVRRVGLNSYEAAFCYHGKNIYCGCYSSPDLAHDAVIRGKIELFDDTVRSNGDDPFTVVESVEPGYFVSPKGNIYNRNGDLMVGAVDHNGYKQLILNRRNRNVHRIVAESFLPNPDRLPCVNHKDGNKLNNSLCNLEWCTQSENVRHSYRNKLQKTSGNPYGTFRVLSEEDLQTIRDLHHKGVIDSEIAKEIGCSRSVVSRKIRKWGIRNDHD